MTFKLGMFSLFVIFSFTYAVVEIDQSCVSNYPIWVKEAFDEGINLVQKAAQTLKELLTMAEMPIQAKIILDTFLADNDLDTYQSILGISY